MEQTMDLARLTLSKLSGEHFLKVDAADSVSQVVDKLRDHQCAAAVFSVGEKWQVVSAEILPWLLLKGSEALQEPVSAVGQPLPTLNPHDGLDRLKEALGQSAWVATVAEGVPVSLLSWASWARFTARHRVASPYLFSPEWGRIPASVAQVK